MIAKETMHSGRYTRPNPRTPKKKPTNTEAQYPTVTIRAHRALVDRTSVMRRRTSSHPIGTIDTYASTANFKLLLKPNDAVDLNTTSAAAAEISSSKCAPVK